MTKVSHLRSLGGFDHAKSFSFHVVIYLELATSASECKLCPATWESRERGLAFLVVGHQYLVRHLAWQTVGSEMLSTTTKRSL